MDSKPCNDLGRVNGIEVKYLCDCFAKPAYQKYRVATLKVLEQLLPPPTSMIRGNPRSDGELRKAAGDAEQPVNFDDLVGVLTGKLRLITETDGPTCDPLGPSNPAAAARQTHYQLAHDFLVRPIRRMAGERERLDQEGPGQASTRLDHGVVAGSPRRAPAPLDPGVGQHPAIRSSPRMVGRRTVVDRTARHYAVRACGFAAVLLALAVLAWEFKQWVEGPGTGHPARVCIRHEGPGNPRSDAGRSLVGGPHLTRREVDRLAAHPDDPRLLNVRLALLPIDPRQARPLGKQCLEVGPKSLEVIRSALVAQRGRILEADWNMQLIGDSGEV